MQGTIQKVYCRTTVLAVLSLATYTAGATEVNVSGLFKDKAMISIDGGKPRMLSAGETFGGVRLISASSNGATFDIDGKRQTLGMGQSISTSFSGGEKPTVKLTADSSGHFSTVGSINGFPVRFLVDTGATTIAINSAEATRMGINYRAGERAFTSTANGVVPVYKVTLQNVKLGNISLNLVEGTIMEGGGLPVALLGMSFLSRVEMHRDNSVLTLTKQY